MRVYEVARETLETSVYLKINIDGVGKYKIDTGIGFFDHLLSSFAKHGCFDLIVKVKGDLDVDDHHTVEDVGICLGLALSKIERKNIFRFGWAIVPMDEARATVSIDLGGRSYLVSNYIPKREYLGSLSTENINHFFQSVASYGFLNIHYEVIGENEHHKVEALFKAFGLALDMATKIDERKGVVSTKGDVKL
ncbi:Imidazoleglycerol-phosphate dehydratase [Methanocaldococcus infernus ME]|uniref:Imidazoleglycerol-phosphate dehydratase n=1 Tax=Methanocaldococcus infernus (strain DSM 11812 / JCM 15783 / ME) TaxID=573063 RepID=D5VTA9_METIM|nr:imidazoleglycerol-phosphate dehydratase HisB [Methanocaldococcus infernus]ADG13812.1 Imidazoleglycerol-phosphate dehydratase [Methanocaldococcus infernus ME]